jgi:uncharacterized protein (TIGR04206 family)
MARIAPGLAILKALWLASWRDVQSFRSIAGQNFLVVVLLVAYQQPSSVEFFVVILAGIMIFPLSADAMGRIPFERRSSWPTGKLDWAVARVGSLACNPIVWLSLWLLIRTGWRMCAFALACGAGMQAVKRLTKTLAGDSSESWLRLLPAPPGVFGSIMRLQWRQMLRTLDVYVALALAVCVGLYRASGKILDPAAPQIISLLISLAMSTETQVLLSIDGSAAERYRQWPLRGWQVLLAKDLAYLSMLSVLVLPFDFVSGFASGVGVLAVGHHRSVLRRIPQTPWRFTSGLLFPDGVIQIIVLFGVGVEIKSMVLPVGCICVVMWLASLWFYGRKWDSGRQRVFVFIA